MKLETILSANCSEAVFRFYTLDPQNIQFILQAIADGISANTDFKSHQNQKIPLFKTAKEYDTGYHKITNKEWKELNKIEDKDKKWDLVDRMKYPKSSLLFACAGLGDNEAVITIEKKKGAFRLNIGNNDISPDKTGWVNKVKSLKIKLEEAETCEELQKYARDCTCGCKFFK